MKKIVVAGGGHGGIGVASLLASRGYDVTVYERHAENKMGYDWTDIFAPGAFAHIEMPMPDQSLYSYKENMTFYGPSFHTGIRQSIPKDKLEIKMERRDIYAHIIKCAKKNGAKFVFECDVSGPIVLGNRVVGIHTARGDVYADLVIDACGMDSPVKNGLPSVCGVNPDTGKNNQFYVYRAFYNRASEEDVADKYKVCLFAERKLGIGWVATEDSCTDLLIGRFEPFDLEEAERTADYYRKTNPSLGTELQRGGQFVKIPVRQPLSKLVCDGYAAIGDAAYMTVPIIGSGIANSFKAAGMLCETIENDVQGAYSADTLWGYQVRYYKALGAGFATLACVKEALTVFTPDELDFLFDSGVLTSSDLSIDADTTDLLKIFGGNNLQSVKIKVFNVVKDKALLKNIMAVSKKIAAVTSVCAAMPKKYAAGPVEKWVRSYEKVINMRLV